jgi:hypothetical protein
VLEGAGEELAGGRQIPLLGHENINDLAVLVDRPVQINPATGNLEVSSTNQRSPAACWHGQAASISSGVNRCTQR